MAGTACRDRASGTRCPTAPSYFHYTSNNTVAGTEFDYIPEVDVPMVVDASSNILSRPWDGGRHGIIYAGAQKNMAMSGVTLVVVRRDLLALCDQDIPTMLRYGVQVEKGSMLNTPPTLAIYVIERVAAWLERHGGLAAMAARNDEQAKRLYDAIDHSSLFRGKAERASRSRMNVTFTTDNPELDTLFWKTAAEQGMNGLKGHRIVGGAAGEHLQRPDRRGHRRTGGLHAHLRAHARAVSACARPLG